MAILVSGGAGYIGSIATAELVSAGHEVVVFDNLYQGHAEAVHPDAAFVQGDLLNALPEKEWHGGRVHEVRENILHLMRGQIFTFSGLTWFTMGGASSHDIQDGVLDPEDPDFEQKYWLLRRMRGMFRVKGRSWWAEEMPNAREYAEALRNLEQVNWKVDCILSHCGPSSAVRKIDPSYGSDQLTDFLETVNQRCQFTYWFFGHYHDNRIIDDRYILQWEQISGLEI